MAAEVRLCFMGLLRHANLVLFLVEVPVDPGSDGLIPTITIEDTDKQPAAKDVPPIPGALPAAKAAPIPDWYKVGWRAFTDIDKPSEDEDQKQLRLMNAWIPDQYYGQWYYNAAVIIFVRQPSTCHPAHVQIPFFSPIIKQGRTCGTLHNPLQSWLWLALHSLGLVQYLLHYLHGACTTSCAGRHST